MSHYHQSHQPNTVDEVKQILRHGTVKVNQIDGITVEGFEFHNCTCRDGAVLACAWAIQELSREMKKMMEGRRR